MGMGTRSIDRRCHTDAVPWYFISITTEYRSIATWARAGNVMMKPIVKTDRRLGKGPARVSRPHCSVDSTQLPPRPQTPHQPLTRGPSRGCIPTPSPVRRRCHIVAYHAPYAWHDSLPVLSRYCVCSAFLSKVLWIAAREVQGFWPPWDCGPCNPDAYVLMPPRVVQTYRVHLA